MSMLYHVITLYMIYQIYGIPCYSIIYGIPGLVICVSCSQEKLLANIDDNQKDLEYVEQESEEV